MVDDSKKPFDALSLEQLDLWYQDNLKQYEDTEGNLDFGEDTNGLFYAKIEQYERYLDARNKILARKPVATKEIVADEDAVIETLRTYQAINKKLQQQIAAGVDLAPMDIKLLVEMMKALNGDK